jgi:hypothetical protein
LCALTAGPSLAYAASGVAFCAGVMWPPQLWWGVGPAALCVTLRLCRPQPTHNYQSVAMWGVCGQEPLSLHLDWIFSHFLVSLLNP